MEILWRRMLEEELHGKANPPRGWSAWNGPIWSKRSCRRTLSLLRNCCAEAVPTLRISPRWPRAASNRPGLRNCWMICATAANPIPTRSLRWDQRFAAKAKARKRGPCQHRTGRSPTIGTLGTGDGRTRRQFGGSPSWRSSFSGRSATPGSRSALTPLRARGASKTTELRMLPPRTCGGNGEVLQSEEMPALQPPSPVPQLLANQPARHRGEHS